MSKVLLLEPDILLADMYAYKIQQQFEVMIARNAQDALDILDSHNDVEVIITDLVAGTHNGVELLHEIRSYDDWLEIPVVLLSSFPANRFRSLALHRYNIVAFLYKPQTTPAEVLKIVNRAVNATL